MINTNETDLGRAKEIGKQLKKEVNKRFKVLEIEIDNVYKVNLVSVVSCPPC
jgi:DNA polymerase alpha subunit A